MALISDIEGAVLDDLEEDRAGSKFWDLTNELRPLLFEGLCEATLLTGEPEFRPNVAYVIPGATTLLPMPAGALAIERIENQATGLPIRKVSVFDLDMDNKTWQNDAPAAAPTEWFPFGLNQFGIHPQLTGNFNAIITVVQFPITTDPPYTGAETFPFQTEFEDPIERYASHAARLKEGGIEFDASMPYYEQYLAAMEELSKFGLRKGGLRFSRIAGSPAVVTDVTQRS